MRGGVDIVQIREKELADGELLAAPRRRRASVTRRLGVPLVVNDRPDLALLVEADFVHVGQDDLPVSTPPVGFGVARRPVDARAEGDRRDGCGLHRRRASVRDADEGGPTGRRSRARPVCRRARAAALVRDRRHRRDERRPRSSRPGATRIAVVRAIGDAPDPERAAASAAGAALPDSGYDWLRRLAAGPR